MQLDFLMKELREGYKAVLTMLKTAGSVRQASDAVLLQFERPADQSETAKKRRASSGRSIMTGTQNPRRDKLWEHSSRD
ncbi:MAG: phage tail tip lysozyme [Lawsonibacter sp.]